MYRGARIRLQQMCRSQIFGMVVAVADKIKIFALSNLTLIFRRGCQAPWHYYEDSDIPACENLTAMDTWFTRNSKENTLVNFIKKNYLNSKAPASILTEL